MPNVTLNLHVPDVSFKIVRGMKGCVLGWASLESLIENPFVHAHGLLVHNVAISTTWVHFGVHTPRRSCSMAHYSCALH